MPETDTQTELADMYHNFSVAEGVIARLQGGLEEAKFQVAELTKIAMSLEEQKENFRKAAFREQIENSRLRAEVERLEAKLAER